MNRDASPSSDLAGVSGSFDGAASSLPLECERDSPSPCRDLCLLVSTFTFLCRQAGSSAYSVGTSIDLFDKVFGASLAGETPTSRAGVAARVEGALPLDILGIPFKPKPPDRTTHEKVAGFPTFVVGRHPADPETDSGGKIVAALTLTEAKTRHKQVPSRDNPDPSALAQKHDEVALRVGRYLAGGDPPPS
ncbi:hypothetical protein BHM03_00061518 [Ensete ventricosum]|nr:hypothetical protein BHM03_00061518 [Ensete ventricosum]